MHAKLDESLPMILFKRISCILSIFVVSILIFILTLEKKNFQNSLGKNIHFNNSFCTLPLKMKWPSPRSNQLALNNWQSLSSITYNYHGKWWIIQRKTVTWKCVFYMILSFFKMNSCMGESQARCMLKILCNNSEESLGGLLQCISSNLIQITLSPNSSPFFSVEQLCRAYLLY